MMKKTFILLFLLFVTFNIRFINVNAADSSTIQNFVDDVTTVSKDFKEWNKLEDFQKNNLYDNSLKLIAYLYENKTGTGYFIYDIKKDEIIEYSAGKSPYGAYLNNYQKNNNINVSGSDKEYLIYEGATFYSFAIKHSGKINYYNDFTEVDVKDKNLKYNESEVLNIDIMADESALTNSLINNNLATAGLTSKVLSGVSDFAWYNGCAPTSAANLIYYWANNGYSKLTTNMTSSKVINALVAYMGTDSSGSTSVSDIGPGVISYIKSKGYTNFTNSNVTNPTFKQCTSEINSSRPALLSLVGDATYGNHTVTLVGYEYGIGPNTLVIHDTWSSTSTNVYIAHSSTVKYLHKFIK
jgi:hypothetical protein